MSLSATSAGTSKFLQLRLKKKWAEKPTKSHNEWIMELRRSPRNVIINGTRCEWKPRNLLEEKRSYHRGPKLLQKTLYKNIFLGIPAAPTKSQPESSLNLWKNRAEIATDIAVIRSVKVKRGRQEGDGKKDVRKCHDRSVPCPSNLILSEAPPPPLP